MSTLDLRNDISDSVNLILEDIDQHFKKIDCIGFYELFEFVSKIIKDIYEFPDDLIVFKTIQDVLLKDKCENVDVDELRNTVVVASL